VSSDLYLFKDGIEPKWEDEANEGGGRFVHCIDKDTPERFNLSWLNLLMTCIGEQFIGFEDQICGAIASVREHGNRVGYIGWKISYPTFRSSSGCATRTTRRR
jgi:translation initiation factor 4E